MKRRLLLLLPTAALVLAGCGSQDDTDHAEADVAFAQQMVPHHEQAVEMAELALDPARGASGPVRDLAGRIGETQEPEIEQMNAWLDDWGVEPDEHGGHDMGAMNGMMSDEDLDVLGRSEGAAFDRAWLSMMIEHHEGAVDMAETEIAEGRAPEAVDLARDVVETQQAEIAEMEGLL